VAAQLPAKKNTVARCHWSQIKRTILIIQNFTSSLWPQAEAPVVAVFGFVRGGNQIKIK